MTDFVTGGISQIAGQRGGTSERFGKCRRWQDCNSNQTSWQTSVPSSEGKQTKVGHLALDRDTMPQVCGKELSYPLLDYGDRRRDREMRCRLTSMVDTARLAGNLVASTSCGILEWMT